MTDQSYEPQAGEPPRPLAGFDYARTNLGARVPYESLVVGRRYLAYVDRVASRTTVEYLGRGRYRVLMPGDKRFDGAVYSDWELDEMASLVVPLEPIA